MVFNIRAPPQKMKNKEEVLDVHTNMNSCIDIF